MPLPPLHLTPEERTSADHRTHHENAITGAMTNVVHLLNR